MKANSLFHKTSKGQFEIENKSQALTMKQRRVLILVDGERDAATLRKLSLCDNIVEILETLQTLGFIELTKAVLEESKMSKAEDYSAKRSARTAPSEVNAREFMCNTLLTFANRVRVGKLIAEINASEDLEVLKTKIKPWYHAISETPGGMYQADDLRKEVLQLIHNEEIGI